MLAHHGTGISYDDTKPEVFKAKITKMVWANPHSVIFFDVLDEAGNKVSEWVAEGNSPYAWGREGWTRNTVKAGDIVTVHLIRSRGGKNVGLLRKIVLPSGEEVLRG
jgi:hypothetical protein